MDYLPYMWIAVMVVLAVFEGLTTQLVSVWFVIGALVAAIVSFFVPVFGVQFAVFVGVSLVLLLVTRYVQKTLLYCRAICFRAFAVYMAQVLIQYNFHTDLVYRAHAPHEPITQYNSCSKISLTLGNAIYRKSFVIQVDRIRNRYFPQPHHVS